MIRRLLAAIGRKAIGDAPTDDTVRGDRVLADEDRDALIVAIGALARRVHPSEDTSPLGAYRRLAYEVAEVAQLQRDAEGMHSAHHDLLTVAGKSGTHIPDVLALEATAYLTAEEIR